MDKDQLTTEEALDLEEIMKLIDSPVQSAQEPEDAVPQDTPAESPEQPKAKEKKKPDQGKSLLMYLHDLAYLMAGIVLLFLLCFRIVVVSGDSMYDTLVDGDYLLLINNVFYQQPEQGDIIVASKESYDNGLPIVKRVIAIEGQTVDIDFITGTVYVDGIALEEDYIYTKTTLDEGMVFPLTVDDGCVFVLGDNRNRSKDSRNPDIGLIDCRQIVGKAVFLMVPGTDNGSEIRDFDRVGVIG